MSKGSGRRPGEGYASNWDAIFGKKDARTAEDRRESQAVFYDAIADRRRPDYDRRGQEPIPAKPGTIRPAVGEAAPPIERRQLIDSGAE